MGLMDMFTGKNQPLSILEEYKNHLMDINYSKEITPLNEQRIREVLPLIDTLIERNTTPLGTDETLIQILDYYINYSEYSDFNSYWEKAKETYETVLPLGIKSDNAEQLTKLYENLFLPNGIFEQNLFNSEFFNLFQNKSNYLITMKELSKKTAKTKQFLPKIVEYSRNNREYFTNEELFTDNLAKTINEINNIDITQGDIDYLLNSLTAENKKRVGIYDISQDKLEEIDDILNSADSVLERLKSQNKLSEETVLELKRQLKTALEELTKQKSENIKNLDLKVKEQLEIFKKELNTALSTEVEKFRQDTDLILNEASLKMDRKSKELSAFVIDLDNSTRKELNRIRKTGSEIEAKIKQAIKDNPDLEKTLQNYLPIPELMKKLNEVQQVVTSTSNVVLPTSEEIITPIKKIVTPTIVLPKDVPSTINHYLDPRIPFTSRFNELEEIIDRNEENGEIYHQKIKTIIKMVMEDCNPYLWGSSGLGKTYLVKQIFNLLGLDYLPINKILEDYDLIGAMLPNGEFSNPLWYQCYKYGKGAFLDELDSSNSEAAIVLNSFTSSDKDVFYPFPNQEIVYRHPNFRIIAAGNTHGNGADENFNDRKKLDESVLQRLMPVYLEPDERIEKTILKDYPEWADFISSFRKATNKYAKSRDLSFAPGEVTTRDAEKIKQLKEDNAFTDEEIMEYEVIETKDDNYLSFLLKQLEKIYESDEEHSKKEKIYTKFLLKDAMK